MVLKTADFERPGAWRELLRAALTLTDHLATVIKKPTWSFGGGTVLMLRLNHRHSKDIDLFVPDPQYLGHFSPRLTDAAEAIASEYVEFAEYIKLKLLEGEIDIVVGTPLTDTPWESGQFEGRSVLVEHCAEIVAKKMHFRGAQAKARDLFDLCAVAEMEPSAIEIARPFLTPNAPAFLARLASHPELTEDEFNKIERIAYDRSFGECLGIAQGLLG